MFLFLYTEWSIYEVKLMFVIIRLDGNTDVYTAREIAHHWVKQTHTQKQNTESSKWSSSDDVVMRKSFNCCLFL